MNEASVLIDQRIAARRAIDIREGEEVDAEAFKALIRAAADLNAAAEAKPKKR